MKTYRDQIGRNVFCSGVPKRIVSLVPSLTELLIDLGLEKYLVGVTKFCVHPDHLRKNKTVVGGTKAVHLEKIKALEPDLIICNKEENTREMVRELEEVAPVHVSDIKTVEDTLDLIGQYGKIFEVEKLAAKLSEAISESLVDLQDFVKERPKRKVAYFIWQHPYMVAGRNTFIDHLLELNNFDNVFKDVEARYPEVVLEEVVKRKVELILLSTEPFPFGEKHKEEFQQFFKGSKVEVVDGEYFSWYGSRLNSAFNYFKSLHSHLCSS